MNASQKIYSIVGVSSLLGISLFALSQLGLDLGGVKDSNGVFFVKDLETAAKEGGGFVDYIFPKPGMGEKPKVSYATMIPGTISCGASLPDSSTDPAKWTPALGVACSRSAFIPRVMRDDHGVGSQ